MIFYVWVFLCLTVFHEELSKHFSIIVNFAKKNTLFTFLENVTFQLKNNQAKNTFWLSYRTITRNIWWFYILKYLWPSNFLCSNKSFDFEDWYCQSYDTFTSQLPNKIPKYYFGSASYHYHSVWCAELIIHSCASRKSNMININMIDHDK